MIMLMLQNWKWVLTYSVCSWRQYEAETGDAENNHDLDEHQEDDTADEHSVRISARLGL